MCVHRWTRAAANSLSLLVKLEAAKVHHIKIVKKLGEVEADKAEADKELSAANAS